MHRICRLGVRRLRQRTSQKEQQLVEQRHRQVIRKIGAGLAGLGLVAIAAPAFGQEPALDEVIVTARKTAEALSDAPLSVTAYGRADLAAQRALRLSDLKAAPGFAIEKTIGVDTVFIRGVGGGGRNIGFGARVGVYVDGIFIGQVGALNPALNDISRVEILSGPQGTLFGRNAVAGAVSITSAPPSATPSAWAQARLGSHGDRGLDGQVEGALAPGLSAKLSVGVQHRDGHIRNRVSARPSLGATDIRAARLAVRAEPAERLVIDLYGDLADDRSTTGIFESVSTPFGAGAFDPEAPARDEVSLGRSPDRDNRVGGVTTISTYTPSEAVSLVWVFGKRSTRARRITDNDYSAMDILSTRYTDRYEQTSNEVRATGRWRRLSYVAGIATLREVAVASRIAAAGPDALRFGLPLASAPLDARQVTRANAAFVSADLDLATGLVLNVGMRVNHERRRLLFNLDGSRSGGFDIGTLNNFRDRASETSTTPTASLSWRAAPGVNLYARYAQGFKSGGWNVDFLSRAQVMPLPGSTATPFAFMPEDVKSLEVGGRFSGLGNRLSGNIAIFDARYDDYQVNQFSVIDGRTIIRLTNAAVARSRGVEMAGRLAPVPAVVVSGNLSLLRATFGSFAGGGAAGADATGNRLALAPKISGSLRFAYRPALGGGGRPLEAAVAYRYRGGVFAGQENTADQIVPKNAVMDASLAWTAPSIGVTTVLWVDNAFNDRSLNNRGRDFLGTQGASYNEPRRFGVTVSARI
jgi:iron complex outermembrane receptor protein